MVLSPQVWRDIFLRYNILEYVASSIQDLHQLSMIDKNTRESINLKRCFQNLCSRNMKRYLRSNFSIDPTAFFIALHRSESMISGSFALQTSSGQQDVLPTSDIDIYTKKGNDYNINIMKEYLKENGYFLTYTRTYDENLVEDHILENNTFIFDDYKILAGVLIHKVESYQNINLRQIQVIESRNINITAKQIVDSFDISVCQNTITCEVTENNGDEKNITYNINNRDICFAPQFLIKHSKDVIFKVLKINPDIKNSFEIVSRQYPLDIIFYNIDVLLIAITTLLRIEKYRQRGFQCEDELQYTRDDIADLLPIDIIMQYSNIPSNLTVDCIGTHFF